MHLDWCTWKNIHKIKKKVHKGDEFIVCNDSIPLYDEVKKKNAKSFEIRFVVMVSEANDITLILIGKKVLWFRKGANTNICMNAHHKKSKMHYAIKMISNDSTWFVLRLKKNTYSYLVDILFHFSANLFVFINVTALLVIVRLE